MQKSVLKLWAVAMFSSFLLAGLVPGATFASPPTGDVVFIELKMTGSESIVIENNTAGTINLQSYLLQYFNKSVPINFNVPTDSQALPDFSLAPQQSFLLSGDTSATCGARGESNLAITLSDTAGYVQLVKVSQQSGSTIYTPQDHANWTSAAGSVGDGIDLHSVTSTAGSINSTNSVYYRLLSDSSWQRFGIDATPCSLLVTVSNNSDTTFIQWATGQEAPAVVTAASDSGSGSIPLSDIGLAAPQVTELLPNPATPQSDDEDEFIELHNPNSASFDLSGFKLQVGLTTKHTYTIPAGTSIAAKSFKAFFSVDTNLAMSNSSGQAALIDPLGNVISQSDPYGTAKDGQSWALANGKWYWTTNPTPGAANTVSLSSASTKPSSKGTAGTLTTNSASTGSNATGSNLPAATPIHSWTLAGVGSAAVLYAAYEYRHDLANNIYRLRRYREVRAVTGAKLVPASLSGISGRFGQWQNNLRSRASQRFKK